MVDFMHSELCAHEIEVIAAVTFIVDEELSWAFDTDFAFEVPSGCKR